MVHNRLKRNLMLLRSFQEKIRHALSDPQLGFVTSVGYVSLFPFLLEILEPDNPKLETILKVLNKSLLAMI